MSFRNRCVVVGSHSAITLSIPLEHGREQRLPLREVRIDNREGWQLNHWRTIVSCYNRSPWFEFYRSKLEELYTRKFDFLVDWNNHCWEWSSQQLGAKWGMDHTLEYHSYYDGSECVDWRNKVLPKNIETVFPDPVRYHQVFEDRIGFVPHCSILDLLFCEGKNALNILKRP